MITPLLVFLNKFDHQKQIILPFNKTFFLPGHLKKKRKRN